MEVNIHEAKTQLSRLIERALRGEEVIIAKTGRPVVRLIPIQKPKPILGSARGRRIGFWNLRQTQAERQCF